MRWIALVLAGGCSFVTTRSSPRHESCGSYTPAVVDAVITTAVLALTVKSYRENRCAGPDGCHNYDPTGLYVVPLLVFGASTAWGFGAESSCRAKLRLARQSAVAPAARSTPARRRP